MADGLKVNFGVDTTQGDKAIADLAKRIDSLANKISDSFKVDIDGNAASSSMKKLASSFDDTLASLQEVNNTQKSALAGLIAGGKRGSAEFHSLAAEIKKTEAEIQKLESAADQAGNGITDIGDIISKAFSFNAAAQAGEFLSGLSEQGNEYNKTLKSLSAQTGLYGDALDAIASRAEDAFVSGVGENLEESMKIMGTAKQQLSGFFSDTDIDSFVVKAAGIGKVFDKDVNEVIAKSRTFLQAFNLDGESGGNLIALSMQKANTAMDDVLDTLDEYSPLMKAAGFDAEEFVGVLTRGVEAGARDTDKIADSLKEAGIRLKAGDITTALADIATPVSNTIKGIVAAGEAGTKSVKDVVFESSAAIETAFNAGEISESVRSQLQVAIAGTPAEDIGSNLYGRIFGAPIDADAIKMKAEIAGRQIESSLTPANFGETLSRQFEVIGAKASSIFAPILSGAGSVLSTVGQLGPAFSVAFSHGPQIKEMATSLLSKLLPALFTQTAATGAATTAQTGLNIAMLANPIGLIIAGIAVLTGALVWFFTQTKAGQEAFETAFGYVASFVENVGPLLEALFNVAIEYLNPINWVDGGDSIEKAKAKLGEVVDNITQGAKDKIAQSGLDDALADALVIKENLDGANALADLIERYKTATGDQKNNIAAQIADKIPGAISGMNQIVDAQGNITTQYEISTEKAEAFATAQKNGYSDELQSKQQAYGDGLKGHIGDYERNKQKLVELGQEIVNANDPETVKDLQEQYKELETQTNENAGAIKRTVDEGKKTGLITGEVGELEKKYGLTTKQAQLTADATTKIDAAAQNAAASASDMAAEFQKAADNSQAALNTLKGELAGLEARIRTSSGDDQAKLKAIYAEKLAEAKKEARAIVDGGGIIAKVEKDIGVQSFADSEARRKEAEDRRKEAAEKRRAAAEARREQLDRELDADIQIEKNKGQALVDAIEDTLTRELAQLELNQRILTAQHNKQTTNEAKDKSLSPKQRAQNIEIRQSEITKIEDAIKDFTTNKIDEIGIEVLAAHDTVFQRETEFLRGQNDLRIVRTVEGLNDLSNAQRQAIERDAESRINTAINADAKFLAHMKASTEQQRKAVVEAELALGKARASGTASESDIASLTASLASARAGLNTTLLGLRSDYLKSLDPSSDLAKNIAIINDSTTKALRDLTSSFESQYISLLKKTEDAIDVTTIEGLKRRHKIRMERLDEEFADEYDALIESLAAKELAQIDSDLRVGKISQAQADAKRQELRNVYADNPEVIALIERQGRLRVNTEAETAKDIQKIRDDENSLLAAALSIHSALFTGFYDEKDEQRQKDLQKELQTIGTEEQELKESLLRKQISLEDYHDAASDLAKQRVEKEKELGSSSDDFWQGMLRGVGNVGVKLQADFSERLKTSQGKLQTSFTATSEAMAAGEEVNTEELVNDLQAVGEASAGMLLGVWSEMAASGKATLGDFADAALLTTISTIRSMVEGNIIGIITAAFAINPYLGIASIPAVLIVEALLAQWEATVKGRLGANGFELGGMVHGPEQFVRINENGEEYIVNAEATRKHPDLLDAINRGEDISKYFVNTSGQLQHSYDYATAKEVVMLRKEMNHLQQQTNKNLGDIRDAIRNGIPVHGSSFLHRDHVYQSVESSRRNSRGQ